MSSIYVIDELSALSIVQNILPTTAFSVSYALIYVCTHTIVKFINNS